MTVLELPLLGYTAQTGPPAPSSDPRPGLAETARPRERALTPRRRSDHQGHTRARELTSRFRSRHSRIGVGGELLMARGGARRFIPTG